MKTAEKMALLLVLWLGFSGIWFASSALAQSAELGEGKREDLAQPGRMSFTSYLAARSQYPIKVVGLEQGKDLLIITAYPLKKGRS